MALYAFSRTERLIGAEALQKLAQSHVIVFGVGGVGGYVVEVLARSGVGSLTLVDSDRVALTNINRQIYATHKTIGRMKIDVAKERISEINPQCTVHTLPLFYLPETAEQIDFSAYDYIVDAVDTVSAKIDLVVQASAVHIPIISAMGAGNKMDATAFEVADLYETSVCPLARVMRRELRKRGISYLKVVYSREEPIASKGDAEQKAVPGSNAFVPAVAGLILAGEVVSDLIRGAR